MFCALQVVKYIAFDSMAFLFFANLVPNLRETAVVTATEVLSCNNPLLIEIGKCLVQTVAVGRGFPIRLLSVMQSNQFSNESLDGRLQIFAVMFFKRIMRRVLHYAMYGFEAFANAGFNEGTDIVENFIHREIQERGRTWVNSFGVVLVPK